MLRRVFRAFAGLTAVGVVAASSVLSMGSARADARVEAAARMFGLSTYQVVTISHGSDDSGALVKAVNAAAPGAVILWLPDPSYTFRSAVEVNKGTGHDWPA